MKNSPTQLGVFMLVLLFASCKTDQEEKAEKVTINYVRFIDSITNKGTSNAAKNWNTIAQDYDKKSAELNIEIDKLEDITIFDKTINPATAKYEDFKKLTLQKKAEPQKEVTLN